MSKHDFTVFPTSIASALTRAFGSYLVPGGAAVRHPNGFEELLVSYPRLDEAFPEHFPLYTEGFRERDVEVAPVVQEPETTPAEPETEDKPVDEAKPVEPPAPVKGKPGPKPKAKAE